MRSRCYPLLFMVLLLCGVPLISLEMSVGELLLTVSERYGTFNIERQVNEDEAYNIFSSRDISTSYITIRMDNRSYKMGSSISFKQAIEETDAGAVITWSGSKLLVSLTITLEKARGASTETLIRAVLDVTNLSDSACSLGVQFLMDTHLGEARREHFTLSTGEVLVAEKSIFYPLPDYWISSSSPEHSLWVGTNLRGVTSPDSVVFGNWQHLDEGGWNFVSVDRSFSYPPYSIDDSAVVHRYNEKELRPDETRQITMLLGIDPSNTAGMQQQQSFSQSRGQPDVVESDGFSSNEPTGSIELSEGFPDSYSLEDLIRLDIQVILSLLSRVNSLRRSGEASEETLEYFRALIEVLELRKMRYQAR